HLRRAYGRVVLVQRRCGLDGAPQTAKGARGKDRSMRSTPATCFVLLLLAMGCAQSKVTAVPRVEAEQPKPTAKPEAAPVPKSTAPTVNAPRTMQFVKEIVALGP